MRISVRLWHKAENNAGYRNETEEKTEKEAAE